MERQRVESENLYEVGYDPERHELEVVFRHARGWAYTYTNVSPNLFKRLMRAPSLGRFFARRIRLNRQHPYTKRSI